MAPRIEVNTLGVVSPVLESDQGFGLTDNGKKVKVATAGEPLRPSLGMEVGLGGEKSFENFDNFRLAYSLKVGGTIGETHKMGEAKATVGLERLFADGSTRVGLHAGIAALHTDISKENFLGGIPDGRQDSKTELAPCFTFEIVPYVEGGRAWTIGFGTILTDTPSGEIYFGLRRDFGDSEKPKESFLEAVRGNIDIIEKTFRTLELPLNPAWFQLLIEKKEAWNTNQEEYIYQLEAINEWIDWMIQPDKNSTQGWVDADLPTLDIQKQIIDQEITTHLLRSTKTEVLAEGSKYKDRLDTLNERLILGAYEKLTGSKLMEAIRAKGETLRGILANPTKGFDLKPVVTDYRTFLENMQSAVEGLKKLLPAGRVKEKQVLVEMGEEINCLINPLDSKITKCDNTISLPTLGKLLPATPTPVKTNASGGTIEE